MKILMLMPDPRVKGPVPKHTPLLISALESLGCEVKTELWGRHSEDETLSDKVLGRAKDALRIRRRLRDETFDLMIVKTAHTAHGVARDLVLLAATKHLRAATVLQFHGSVPNLLFERGLLLFKLASAALIRLCDGALVLSTEEKAQWEKFYPRGRFRVVANPHAPPSFEISHQALVARAKDLWSLPDGKPVVLFASRLLADKGAFDLVDALTFFDESQRPYLLFAGDGADAEALRAHVAKTNLNDDVTFAGYLENENLAAAYAAADVFALPTRMFEGFPTAIAEAMSAGLPIVTTAVRGIRDHLREDENALFAPQANPQALADCLRTLLENRALRERMARANREAVRKFAPDAVGREYLQAVIEIMREKESVSRAREKSCAASQD